MIFQLSQQGWQELGVWDKGQPSRSPAGAGCEEAPLGTAAAGFPNGYRSPFVAFLPVEQLNLHLQGPNGIPVRAQLPGDSGRHGPASDCRTGSEPTRNLAKPTAGSSNKPQPGGVNSLSVH